MLAKIFFLKLFQKFDNFQIFDGPLSYTFGGLKVLLGDFFLARQVLFVIFPSFIENFRKLLIFWGDFTNYWELL